MKYLYSIICLIFISGISTKLYSQKGNEMAVNAGVSFGVDNYPVTMYSATIVEGYRFNKYFYTGIGAGLTYANIRDVLYLDDSGHATKSNKGTWLVPLFLNGKVNLPSGRISPFVSLNIGYTFDVQEGTALGFMFEPAVGVDYNLNDKKAIFLLVGFNMQLGESYEISYIGEGTTVRTEMLKAISLRVGFKF